MGDKHAPIKILFVCRGNKTNVISPIIRAQAESLEAAGQKVTIFPLEGKGKLIYFKNIIDLRRCIKEGNYDIVHAHYGFSGITCSFATHRKKLVVSLMGSEMYYSVFMKRVYRLFSRLFWIKTIVKTEAMARLLESHRAIVISNGVNLDLFRPFEKAVARAKLGLSMNRKILLFPSYTFRKEKNYHFLKNLTAGFNNVELRNFNADPPEVINFLYNAADVIVMASSFEGSPNVIKEAMACNRSIVATDVGDVKLIMAETEGCFIADLNEDDYTQKLKSALAFSGSIGSTNGRERIINLNLDSASVAQKIISLYREILAIEKP